MSDVMATRPLSEFEQVSREARGRRRLERDDRIANLLGLIDRLATELARRDNPVPESVCIAENPHREIEREPRHDVSRMLERPVLRPVKGDLG